MRTGLVAEKIGMTRFFDESGVHVPVTILKVDRTVVLDVKVASSHGYTALVLGTKPVKVERLNKPQKVFFEKKNLGFFKTLKEFRVTEDQVVPVGEEITVNHFKAGDVVDIVGTTIGKGFAGVMKRHHFGGLRASHGVSVSHRSHGSTGQRQDPGKVFKGKKMAGHLGCDRVTQQNLKVVQVDSGRGLVFIKGSVPGSDRGTVYISDAVKNKRGQS